MSSNLSRKRRDVLVKELNDIRSALTAQAKVDKNAAQLLSYVDDLENEIGRKKFGLIFEKHEDNIDIHLKSHVPILTEEKVLSIDMGGQINFIIEGDNLPALQLLEKTKAGKIDIIYIDPPYNTGHTNFIYDDAFIGENDAYRHSKWLSFMESRLIIAKQLLATSGIIFISINDIELAQLTMLCDEIFGETNRITTFPRKGTGGRQDSTHFAVVHDYVLCYAKSIKKYQSGTEENSTKKYPYFDEKKGRYYKTQLLRKWGDASRREDRPNEYYPIYLSNAGKLELERKNKTDIEIFPMLSKTECGRWRWGKDRMLLELQADNVEVKKVKGEYIPYERLYKENDDEDDVKLFTSWLDNISAASGSKLIENMIGKNDFDYPKPLDLLVKLIFMGSDSKEATILDFFAGTGTTAHAVLEANKIDNGARKFIVVTNNQNKICENITYPRIKKAIMGYDYNGTYKSTLFSEKLTYNKLKTVGEKLEKADAIIETERERFDEIEKECKDGILSITGIKKGNVHVEGNKASLKYYKIDYVNITDKLYYEYADELLKHVRELVELENGVDFVHNSEISIILTDAELRLFAENESLLKKTKRIYLGHNVLANGQQKQLFKKNGIKVNIIPNYYYRDLGY